MTSLHDVTRFPQAGAYVVDSNTLYRQAERYAKAKNTLQAKNLYQQAAEMGHPQAQFELALIYLSTEHIPGDRNSELAKEWFQKAYDNGVQNAQPFLLLYQGNRGDTIHLNEDGKGNLVATLERGTSSPLLPDRSRLSCKHKCTLITFIVIPSILSLGTSVITIISGLTPCVCKIDALCHTKFFGTVAITLSIFAVLCSLCCSNPRSIHRKCNIACSLPIAICVCAFVITTLILTAKNKIPCPK